MSEAMTKEKAKEPESLAPRTRFETMSRLEEDMERMFHEFWRRPLFSLLGARALVAEQGSSGSNACGGCV
jgi:hypothetical protein